jgi:hypothetical protein
MGNYMKVEQTKWSSLYGWEPKGLGRLAESAQLVLIFGSTSLFKDEKYINEIKSIYRNACFFGCSTAGEIFGTQVFDETLVITAIEFDSTQIKGARAKIGKVYDSYQLGKYLINSLDKEELVHVLVLSDGLKINGSELVKGLTRNLPPNVTVTGGLSGDGERFEETYVLWDSKPETNTIGVVGLYSKRLKVGYGSLGGWDPFGPERLITKSKGNVLYEVDGKSVLDLYKMYLGEHAEGLPAAGILFPLSIRRNDRGVGVVRTVSSINDQEQSITFAGDVPEGFYVRLMKANFNHLIDGAVGAAKTSCEAVSSSNPDLAILISCVYRKRLLKHRIDEEVRGERGGWGE